jgi:hypothetical protein
MCISKTKGKDRMQLLGLCLIWPISIIVRGFVLQTLWGWFVVTTFAMMALTIPQALGLSAIVVFLTYHINPRRAQKDDHTALEMLFTSLIWSGMVLAMGWIVHLFM